MNTAIAINTSKKYIYRSVVTLIILISMTAVSCKNNTAPSVQNAQLVHQTDSTNTALQDLTAQYDATKLKLDDEMTRNTNLDSQIAIKDAEIAKLKHDIKKANSNNRVLAGKLKKDSQFIASLKNQLSDKAREFAERLGLLQSDRDNLSRQRDSLQVQYASLKQLGSVLHASNIRLAALHLKHHGRKEKKTARARKADVLRVLFDIDDNRIAESGTKELYLIIKDPQGNLLTQPMAANESTTTHDGKRIGYSIEKQISLKQEEPVKDVSADWKEDNYDYKKGAYSIAIYNGGYKIGGGTVMLN